MDGLGLAALAWVSVEWLALGWLSGVSFPAAPRPVQWALRLLVGSCLIAIAQLALAITGIGFGLIGVVLLAAGLGALIVRVVGRPAACRVSQPPAGRTERIGWAMLGVVLAAATLRSLVLPEAGWDAYSHWGLRAQAFALAGTIVDAHSEHEYYPPLVPLLEAWLYLHRGLVSIDLGKTLWAVIGSAFAVCLGWHVRTGLPVAWPAPYVTIAIVLGAPALLESFWTGQADLALTAFFSLAALAVWQWQRSSERAWLVQAAILGAAAALTKFEGLLRIGVVVVALILEASLARQRPLWQPAVTLAVAAATGFVAWNAYAQTHGIATNSEHLGAFQPLAIGSVLAALIAVFGGVRTGGGLVVAALSWLIAFPSLLKSPLRLLTLVVIGELFVTLIAFLVSATAPDLEVRTSATRLFEQFVPLALFVGALALGSVLARSSTYNRRGR